MMQKNEEDLLEPWFRYHAFLFGYENLEVIDNGSTSAHVVRVLKKYENMGCKIHWEYSAAGDFERKGEILGNIIRWWDDHLDYDLAIPLDCDEFVCILSGSRITTKRSELHAYFDSIKHIKKSFILANGLQNIPNQAGWFQLTNVPKGFFAKGTLGYLDQGFHHPRSRVEDGNFYTNIVYVHLHNRPFDKLKKYSAEKLKLRVDVADVAAMRNYNGPGEHLIKYFFMTEVDYIARYEGTISIYFPEFLTVFAALGIDVDQTLGRCEGGSTDIVNDGCCILRSNSYDRKVPNVFKFDIASYSARNPDVEYPAALYHYIEYGFKEGRSAG